MTAKQKHNYTSCKGCESHTENNKTKTPGLKVEKRKKKLVVFDFFKTLSLLFSPSFPSFYFNLLSISSGHRRDDSPLPFAYFPFPRSLKIIVEAAHSHGEPQPFEIKDVVEYEIRILVSLVRKISFYGNVCIEKQSHFSLICQDSVEIFPRKKNLILQYTLKFMPKLKGRTSVLAALKLHYPLQTVYVCSFHFIENKARELHSDPVVSGLLLGRCQPSSKKALKACVSCIQVFTRFQNHKISLFILF